jgi:hypothetical protein
MEVYQGNPWNADESADCVRFFKGNLLIAKVVKRTHEYTAYYPSAETIKWMLNAFNEAEKIKPSPLEK